MAGTDSIIKFNELRNQLVSVIDLDEIKAIRDKAEALRSYCRVAGESFEAQQDCAEIKIRAERRAGELLGVMEKNKGGGDHRSEHRSHDATGDMPTLSDLDITKSQSSRWQKIATISIQLFERFITDTRSKGKELTSAKALKLQRQTEAQSSNGSPVVIDVEPGKYRTIYADPPWKYGNQGTRAATDNHYATLSVEEICEFEIDGVHISDLAAENAHLHLWTTNGFLFDAKRVIDAWGFEYKSCFVWVKTQLGIGNYWRVSHEFLLFGLRGKLSFRNKSQPSWLETPRTLEHSAKPGRIREIVEMVSPIPRLELFGRSKHQGWEVFGNQIENTLFTTKE